MTFSGSFFIPLEQGLKLLVGCYEVLSVRSFFIPLEQGLKQDLPDHQPPQDVLSSFH